ncbi:MAG: flagellar biosynthetic protein FliR [Betaproteobacteria bacterium]|nr:flagellar biosynthetic protein FliR [Betaproteobacteria bacterium]
MFTLNSADLELMAAMFLFPLARILAWLATDPLLGNRAVPVSIRIAAGVVLTMAVAPILPPIPQVALVSAQGLMTLLQQMAIGMALGYSMRILFAGIEFAGSIMGLQMGLSMATLYDPVNGAQTPVISQMVTVTATLILFAMNGHHLVITALAQSFADIPIGATLTGAGFAMLAHWGGSLFSIGLQIALPVTAALITTNLSIGMMTRAAPQLNIFAVGFPLTLSAGFIVLYLSLIYLPATLDRAWGLALSSGIKAMSGMVGR